MQGAESLRRRRAAAETQSEADSEDSHRNSEGDLKSAEKKDWEKRNKNKIITRVVFGVAMIVGFLGVVYAGHFYVCLLVCALQIAIFRELLHVRYKAAKERGIKYFRTVQWLWFALAQFSSSGDSLYTFASRRGNNRVVVLLMKYHYWISFSFYSLVFVVTVLSFKKGYYKYQMGQLAWTFLTLLLTVFQGKYMYQNIFLGLFWFLLHVSLVVCNDCFAYFCGLLFGRKFIKYPFLKLSPNKTWEGFIGAFICTLIFSVFWTRLLAQFEWLICQPDDLFSKDLHCEPSPVFQPHLYKFPASVASLLGVEGFTYLPVQLHGLGLAAFASLVAPFGGFFASAIKRAYNVKDFDSLIPGHGGLTDRMDCQFIMGFCTTVHYNTFILQALPALDVTGILTAIAALSQEDQLAVLRQLQQQLAQQQ